MKKQIAMIQARTEWYDSVNEENRFINLNLAFLRIATICDQLEIDYEIIDYNNEGCEISKEKLLYDLNMIPDLVIVSLDLMGIESAYNITKIIKDNYVTNIMWTSLGIGFLIPFVTLFKEIVLENYLIDYVLYGSENCLTQFFNEYFNSNEIKAPGIGYKLNNKKVFNDLDKEGKYNFIPENYEAVDMEKYIWRYGKDILSPRYIRKQRIIPISTGIGCIYSCTYCINSNKEWKKLFKLKPKEMLVRQLDYLIDKYNPDVIWFQDDNFFIDKERAIEALKLINKKNILWSGQGRANYFHDEYITEDFFREYIAPNCIWFGVGFETFSDSLRKKLNKHVSVEQLERAAYLCDRYNVPFNPAFIFGLVEQSVDELKNDLISILKFHKKYPKTTFSFQLWRPYPGTLEYEKFVQMCGEINFPKKLEEWIDYKYFDDNSYNLPHLSKEFQKLIPISKKIFMIYVQYNNFGVFKIDRLLYPIIIYLFKKDKIVYFITTYFYTHIIFRVFTDKNFRKFIFIKLYKKLKKLKSILPLNL